MLDLLGEMIVVVTVGLMVVWVPLLYWVLDAPNRKMDN